ncbi:hypothetical protein GGS26DRAFT_599745 [Hypomontagnella submonticulosa]|nr:hypothetical protein GGS26DRAFT_599745 [Hypomontagnella submonticulosa]
MAGQLAGSQLVAFCQCEACSHGFKDYCAIKYGYAAHMQIVPTLLVNGLQGKLHLGYKVDQPEDVITCHSVLLCFWSPTIRKAVYDSDQPVTHIWIDFFQMGARSVFLWKQIVQWCYTGRLLDEFTLSEVTIGRRDDIEALWNAATSLEMYELANYCMRHIIVKYTWGLACLSNPALGLPRHCPYNVYGPYLVFVHNQRGHRFQRLFQFMVDLITARGPLQKQARDRATPGTIWSWATYSTGDMGFAEWIDSLGGITHEYRDGFLPTPYNQWYKYWFPIPPRTPVDVRLWAEIHANTVRLEGPPVALLGTWRQVGLGPLAMDEWEFHRVPN